MLHMFRHFLRDISYTAFSIASLVVGLTASLLMLLWVSYEVGYDRYHPQGHRVYTVLINEAYDGRIETYEDTPVRLADFLKKEVPEIEAVSRIDRTKFFLANGNRSLHETGMYADPDYFNVFGIHLIAGNPSNLLRDKNSIVLSEEMARLLFDDGDVVGKTVLADLKTELKVTGIYAQPPVNSSARNFADYILPFELKDRDYANDWESTTVMLHEGTSAQAVEEKISRKFAEWFGHNNSKALLFGLTDWRLRWSFENGQPSGGRIVYLVAFSVAAAFVLIMACINYMNLATARAAQRAREIGVRKMSGATRPVLIRQFLSESMALTVVASLISLLLAYLLLPLFSELTRTHLTFTWANPWLAGALVTIAMATGVVAGSYPALFLSALKPALILKSNPHSPVSGGGFRKALVVFQFTLSIVMVFSALVIWQQLDFLLHKDLGFDRHNVLYVEPRADSHFNKESFKAEVLGHPAIVSAGIGAASPMEVNGTAEVLWPGKNADGNVLLYGASCDPDYLPTLGFNFLAGRNFRADLASDSAAFVITKKAAQVLGFPDPIGQTITYTMFGQQQGKIIGVIEDFHNEDIHLPVSPAIFCYGNASNYGDWARVFVRYREGQLDEALTHIKTVFQKFQPGMPMDYGFLDQDFEVQFYREKLVRKLSIWFTVIAFTIAGLGLFGLTLYSTQRRTREIGVRKVLGASVAQIMVLLCRDFARPVVMSFVLAAPLGYYLMQKFLEGYEFRVTIHPLAFVAVAVFVGAFIMTVVSYLTFRAAQTNPVETLKTE